MLPTLVLAFLQNDMRFTPPSYFGPVFIACLFAGGIGWLVASVLGFARARAFGAPTRWFSLAAVCLLIYHIQFVLFAFLIVLGQQQNDFSAVLEFGAFLNLFIVLGAVCAIMGFVRLTNPRRTAPPQPPVFGE